METIFVTGSAGFIGFHAAMRLLNDGYQVIGLDNMNDYYDVDLKRARLKQLQDQAHYTHYDGDLANSAIITKIFETHKPAKVIHLAAQAGVRYSIENPRAYIDSNVVGFLNILEACRHHKPDHLVYASTSSVYGANRNMPFDEAHHTDHPVTLYAATKKSNEMMAHSYSYLFDMPVTGLRFFTVYGPWGRPDMAYFKFANAIVKGDAIDVYNHGDMKRDFTYIDDIVEGIVRIKDHVATIDSDWNAENPDPQSSGVAPYHLYNIGNNNSENLMDMIAILEQKLGRTAKMNMLDMQPGDVKETWASMNNLYDAVGYKPETSLEKGIGQFVDWYCNYYRVN